MVFCWFAWATYTASFLALNKQQQQQITQLGMLQSYSIKIIMRERLFEIAENVVVFGTLRRVAVVVNEKQYFPMVLFTLINWF